MRPDRRSIAYGRDGKEKNRGNGKQVHFIHHVLQCWSLAVLTDSCRTLPGLQTPSVPDWAGRNRLTRTEKLRSILLCRKVQNWTLEMCISYRIVSNSTSRRPQRNPNGQPAPSPDTGGWPTGRSCSRDTLVHSLPSESECCFGTSASAFASIFSMLATVSFASSAV